jgi:xanthine permease XanP
MSKRPSSLVFSNSETPPLPSIGILALQHSAIVLINLVYIVVITKALGLTSEEQLSVISTTLLICGIGTILQAKFASKLLVVFHPNPIFIPLIIAAGLSQGPSGILVLVASAGIVQFVFGSAVQRFRVLFPPEVCGVVVVMLGVSLLPGTLRGIISHGPTADAAAVVDYGGILIAVVTLAVASVSTVWLRGTARFFAILLGCLAGLVVAYFTDHWEFARVAPDFSGTVSTSNVEWYLANQDKYLSAPFFALPGLHFPGFTFSPGLIPIAAIAALVNVVDELGVLIGTERLEDADWRKPDFRKVSRGLQASGLFTTLSGLVGGVALGMSSANLSLAYATGVTSRVIAMVTGGVLALVAFLPFFLGILRTLPDSVLAGLLFYAAAYFVVSGAELALSRMMSPRRALVIGISVSIGVLVQSVPLVVHDAKESWLEHVLAPMTFATIIAIVLNFIMRIGITQTETVTIQRGDTGEVISEKLDFLGEAWGLHRSTVARADGAMNEIAELFTTMADGPVTCQIRHNELYLLLIFNYEGRPLSPPDRAPTLEELESEGDGLANMSGWIIKKLSDQVSVSSNGRQQTVTIAFEC